MQVDYTETLPCFHPCFCILHVKTLPFKSYLLQAFYAAMLMREPVNKLKESFIQLQLFNVDSN